MALAMGAIAALIQPLSGDRSAKDVAHRQPAKLAAMEALYRTQRDAPLLIGGVPDDATGQVHAGIEIPQALSFLAFGDRHAEVTGLDRIPRSDWPPTFVCHLAFQIMVGTGSLLALWGAVFLVLRSRRSQLLDAPRFLQITALLSPLGFLAVEAGWTVTEVGRQPWIIYGVMRTAEAVSPMPGLSWPLGAVVLVYALLCLVVSVVTVRLIRAIENPLAARSGGHG
jgi:cytochrome d ubiquinol oxidase subunit I